MKNCGEYPSATISKPKQMNILSIFIRDTFFTFSIFTIMYDLPQALNETGSNLDEQLREEPIEPKP